jgi:hypothetical protein
MVDLDLADAKQQPDLHERETRRDQEGAPGMPRIRSRQEKVVAPSASLQIGSLHYPCCPETRGSSTSLHECDTCHPLPHVLLGGS